MVRVVDEEQLIALGHVHTVGAVRELAFAPRLEELAVTVVDHDRVVAAAEEIDVATRVGAHARDVGVTVAGWKLFPALDELVLERAAPHFEHAPKGSCLEVP